MLNFTKGLAFIARPCALANLSKNFNDFMLVSSFQTIQIASYRRKKFHQPTNWARRRGGGYDDNLTLENKEFIEELIIDKYKITDSPLKETPWKRGTYNPDGFNKRLGVLAIKLGSMPQWTKDGKKSFHNTVASY